MTALLLAVLLSGPPSPATSSIELQLERASRYAERCAWVEESLDKLDQAEAAIAAATTKKERRKAWAAWLEVRNDLRAARRAAKIHRTAVSR